MDSLHRSNISLYNIYIIFNFINIKLKALNVVPLVK